MPAREYVTGEDRDMALKLLWNAFLPRLLGMKFSRLFFQSKRAAVRNDDFEELYHRVVWQSKAGVKSLRAISKSATG